MASTVREACYLEVLPNPALLGSLFDAEIRVVPRPGERRCWLPLDAILYAGERRDLGFLLECWCRYRDIDLAETEAVLEGSAAASGGIRIEVALTPPRIVEFLDWVSDLPPLGPTAPPRPSRPCERLRAFLHDDVAATDELRLITAAA